MLPSCEDSGVQQIQADRVGDVATQNKVTMFQLLAYYMALL